MTDRQHQEDVVTRLIRYCHLGPDHAEKLFNTLIAQRRDRIELSGEEIELTREEIGEFVARYSAEVEPALWESKRRKR